VDRLELRRVADTVEGAPEEVSLADGTRISLEHCICIPPHWKGTLVHVCGVASNALAELEALRHELARLERRIWPNGERG
jgi:hypothetical protein